MREADGGGRETIAQEREKEAGRLRTEREQAGEGAGGMQGKSGKRDRRGKLRRGGRRQKQGQKYKGSKDGKM